VGAQYASNQWKILPDAGIILTEGFVSEPNESTIVPLHTVRCPEDKKKKVEQNLGYRK
jgi:hypothetical protein